MRKFWFLSLVMMMAVGFMQTSCSSCSGTNEEATTEPVEELNAVAELIVENTISTDRQYMFLNYNEDYRWYETCIVLKDFLDAEDQDGTITGVSNIFQVVESRDGGYDTEVVMSTHVADTTQIEVKHGFWVEDFPLNDEAVALTFKEAYERLMEANIVKPHSRHVVLRKEVGPNAANPQYIFGNAQAQVYVDASTGDVSAFNPVFGPGFEAPLGEWP